MPYQSTDWQAGDLITEGKMDHAEAGIWEAHYKMGDLTELLTENKDDLVHAINEAAEKAGINFSRALQDALMKQLNIN